MAVGRRSRLVTSLASPRNYAGHAPCKLFTVPNYRDRATLSRTAGQARPSYMAGQHKHLTHCGIRPATVLRNHLLERMHKRRDHDGSQNGNLKLRAKRRRCYSHATRYGYSTCILALSSTCDLISYLERITQSHARQKGMICAQRTHPG